MLKMIIIYLDLSTLVFNNNNNKNVYCCYCYCLKIKFDLCMDTFIEVFLLIEKI